MRRPLKPFVTEYKGSNRRSTTVLETPETARPKLFDILPPAEPEDSYEAAMRAADALFAIRPASAPEPGASAADRSEQNGEQPPSSAPTGRILQAIDEPPPPQFAALEAEYAPKRRGRKPGSKNKPKPLVADVAADVASAPTPKRRGRPPGKAASQSAPQAIPAIATLAALQNAPPAAASSTNGNGLAVRDEKRFSWVRDRLKPGEAWKRRRLPRVCW